MDKTLVIIAIAGLLGGTAVAVNSSTKPTEKPEVTVLQINAKWNKYNTREDLERLNGCEYKFGWLEEQPVELQKTISAVPVVVIYDEGKPVYQYVADISFKLKTPFEEIQSQVYKEVED